MTDLTRKRDRDRLPVRRDPYFLKLGRGAFLGFRRGADTWVARFRGRDGKQHTHALGDVQEYDDAKRAAEAWISELSGAVVAVIKRGGAGTVRKALEAYLDYLREQGRSASATDIEGRFKSCVYKDPLASVVLETATQDDFAAWRRRLIKGRQPRSVNRLVRAVAAALSRAKKLGYIATEGEPWQLEQLQDDAEDAGETAVFLKPAQRKALIAACTERAAAFFKALEHTGARPKELADAKVQDFDGSNLRLATRKGRGSKLRVRYTVLGKAGEGFFKSLCSDRPMDDWLLTEDGESQWRRHYWARACRNAVAKVNEEAKEGTDRIPDGASAYSFRHARISELLQIHNIDPLTVAQQTGTSVAMIEKAYFKFIPSALKERLESLKT